MPATNYLKAVIRHESEPGILAEPPIELYEFFDDRRKGQAILARERMADRVSLEVTCRERLHDRRYRGGYRPTAKTTIWKPVPEFGMTQLGDLS